MLGISKRLLKKAGLGIVLLLMIAGGFIAHEWYAEKPFYSNNFANRTFLKYVLRSPEQLTSMRILERFGMNAHNAEWDDCTIAASDNEFEFFENSVNSMNLYGDDELTESELVSKKVAIELLGDLDNDKKFRFHNYPINQISGMHIWIPRFLDNSHQISTNEDAEHYISRLSTLDVRFEQCMEGILVREEMGIIPPTFVIDKSVANMQTFIDQPAEENILYVSFDKKLKAATTIDAAAANKFLTLAKLEIENTIYPTWRSYIEYFTLLREKSTTDAGVWKFPDGEAFYDYTISKRTTSKLTAKEIHQIGLEEVNRIKDEILTIFEAEGYDLSKGYLTLIKDLSEEERFHYPDSDDVRTQILAEYRKIINEIETEQNQYFNVLPKASVEVKRIPKFSEKTAPSAYYSGPSVDGSRPGTFFVNLNDINKFTKFGMRTLAYHEAIPGHHFQIALQNELNDIPFFRTQVGFTAYSEGWALYAERLAYEQGFHKDPYDNIGRLQAEMMRAVRLVVDTGIHSKRWTREKAIEYMQNNTGMSLSSVVVEIERYIVWPGQALAYKVGMMEILRLRQMAKTKLGEKFDIREFHDVVLLGGSMPLHVLSEQVSKYIANRK